MKIVLNNNRKTRLILNGFISNGFYKGTIESNKFELKRDYFPNNIIVTGNLKEDDFFEIDYSFQKPMNILVKILFILGTILSMIFLIKQNYIIPILFIIFALIIYINFRIKGKRELEIFNNRIITFSKRLI